MAFRYSRHAKNGLRWLGATEEEFDEILWAHAPHDLDEDGRPRFIVNYEGKLVRVVVALDRPGYVITLHEWRPR